MQRELLGEPGYDLERIRCTDDPSPWFVAQAATVFVCTVGRSDGGCDWYRVEVDDGVPAVMLDERDAGCILPF